MTAYSDRVIEAVTAGRKIEAIKLLREETGMGLKEAKHAVEDLERSFGLPTASNSGGCSGSIVLVGLAVAGALIYRYLAA